MQNLEGCKPSIAFDDRVFALLTRWENDQRLVLKEAVIEVGLRQLLQYPLLMQKIQEFGLGSPMKPLGETGVVTVKQQVGDGNVLHSRWP